jgi:hypothetical protein
MTTDKKATTSKTRRGENGRGEKEERTGDTYVKIKAKQQDTRQQDKTKQNKKI